MTVCCPGWMGPTRTTESDLKRIISTNCCIHTIVPPDDGLSCARNMWRLTKYTKNNLIFVVPCIMLNSEINPTRCNNCVYSSQWLYNCRACLYNLSLSVCFLIYRYLISWLMRKWIAALYVLWHCWFLPLIRILIYFGLSRFCLQILSYQMAAFVLYSFLLVFLYW